MKTIILTFSLFYLPNAASQSNPIREKMIKKRELPGLKISATNSILLEQSVRRAFKKVKPEEVENIEVHLKCKKKWKVRGRRNAKAYQCEPIFLKVLR